MGRSLTEGRVLWRGMLCAAALAGVAAAAGCKGREADKIKPAPAPPPRDPKVADGQAAYAKYCALCHGADAKGYAADHAPSLISDTFLSSASDSYLSRSIREGRPGTAMAGYAKQYGGPLDDKDVQNIIAFLRTKGPALSPLPPARASAGSAARGEEIFTRECARCHGTRDNRGFAVNLANATFLSTASDEFLRFAVQMGRPGTPMPSFIGSLQPAEIDDVVAFVRSWGTPPTVRSTIQHPEVPKGPVLINPSGGKPKFSLREGRFVPAAEVKKALDDKKRIVIIDARATSDWHMVHIPGSISVPYYGFDRLNDIPNDGTWVVAYCACPHHASGVVVDELRKRGYANSAVLDEGILEWQKRKYPTASTPQPAGSASAAPAVGPRGVLQALPRP